MTKVVSIILGGGKGTRLYPLTKSRSKPAVPFGGKHRIIDIPISNCINSGFRQIYVLTQFNSASLHLHIARAYRFDSFSNGFVEILAAEQTFEHSGWYGGTADAVRKNFAHFKPQQPKHYVILSGDQLYRMDLSEFLRKHEESGSDITIACTPVNRFDASGFGIMQVDKDLNITAFMEKPGTEKNIDEWKIPRDSHISGNESGKEYLASMGIYIFTAEAMEACLNNTMTDFGNEIIPDALTRHKVSAFVHNGYWEDIGTVHSFYEATLDLTEITPKFNFYDADMPIYTRPRHLPASKANSAQLDRVICSEGCVITHAFIRQSVIGIRSIIESDSVLEGVICMGADYYETKEEKEKNTAANIPLIGIGSHCRIKKAIIDKNARIGNNVSIGMGETPPDGDYGFYHVVDGIYIIVKGAVVPDNTII